MYYKKKSLLSAFRNYYAFHYQLRKILYNFTWSCFFIIFHGRDRTSLINYVSKYILAIVFILYGYYTKFIQNLLSIISYNLIYKICYFSKIPAPTIGPIIVNAFAKTKQTFM